MGKVKSFYWEEIQAMSNQQNDELFDCQDERLQEDAHDIETEMALGYLEGCGLTRKEIIKKYSDSEIIGFHRDGSCPCIGGE